MGSVTSNFSDRETVTVNELVADRRVVSTYTGEAATLVVPASNPFYVNPLGGTNPVTVAYGFGSDLGPEISDVDVRSGNLSIISLYKLSDDLKLTNTGTVAFVRQNQGQSGAVNFDALNRALADANPNTAFDPFGDGSHTNAATLASLRTRWGSTVDSTAAELGAAVDGSILHRPTDDLKFALGAELRDQELSLGGVSVNGAEPVDEGLHRRIAAAYGQAVYTLAKPGYCISGTCTLKLSGAVRYEHYSDPFGAASPNLGVEWSPLVGLTLQGTVARSFRAPNLPDKVEKGNFSELYVITNPDSPRGDSTVLLWGGANAALQPERARSWTLGLKTDRDWLPGFTGAVTYFDVLYSDLISQPNLSAGILTNPSAAWLVTRNVSEEHRKSVCSRTAFLGLSGDCLAAPIDALVDLREQNMSTLGTRGLDIDSRYVGGAFHGKLILDLGATYVLSYALASAPGSSPIELANTQSNPLRLQLRSSVSWEYQQLGVTESISYAGAYRDVSSVPNRGVASSTSLDGEVRYEITRTAADISLKVALSVQNVFNQAPPFLNNQAAAIGYDQENADLTGRVVRLLLRETW